MVLGIICVIMLVVALIIGSVVASKFEAIAIQKGYDSSIHSWAMCFWLGIVGCLYVIALPDKSAKNLQNSTNTHGSNVDPLQFNFEDNIEINDESKKKYIDLLKKAEKYKDTFYDRNYRISVYESIIKDIQPFANINFEDAPKRLEEYKLHLEFLKTKQIK